MKSVVLVLVLVSSVFGTTEIRYDIPEPTFDVYTPRGLRISIVADSPDVQDVEFTLTVPGRRDPVVHKSSSPERGYWTFWDPTVMVHQHEKIRYKIVVTHHGDLFCSREGVHVVQRVLPLGSQTETHSNIDQGQKVISAFPTLDESEHHVGRISSGKSSNFKSSYSMYKNSDLKPVTKSTTSTTSSTFYLKPSGVVEASGYQEGSSYDSTKNKEQQWEHYRRELTAEELEKMRQIYGAGFDLNGWKMLPGGIKNFDKSYFASEFKYGPTAPEIFGTNSPGKAEFHESHQTHETSSFSQSGRPSLRFQFEGAERSDTATSESSYKQETAEQVRQSLPAARVVQRTNEYVHEERTIPSRDQVISERAMHSSYSNDYSHHDQRKVKPAFQAEFSSADRVRTENRAQSYQGSIFTSYKSVKPRFPQECTLTPDSDYTSFGNLREVERFARELSCLASIAETSLKDEINELKQKNSYYEKKLDVLEEEMRQFRRSCKCQ
ncbi:hypothetical protein RUM43_010152 [Polyplax serrata]|uniref:CBM39 domain-containing protein n=1 Tax=Polyplax serrata TaxID=468196 RepID=A0AAN8S729_POLSC